MGDIRIVWAPGGFSGDWAMSGPDLDRGDDLATAILVSLFTHQRASDDYVIPDAIEDRRGWWADSFEPPAYPIGSRLWQFYRATRTEETLNDVRDVCAGALQWLIDDQVAETVDVTTQFRGRSGIAIGIVVRQPAQVPARFAFVWNMEAR